MIIFAKNKLHHPILRNNLFGDNKLFFSLPLLSLPCALIHFYHGVLSQFFHGDSFTHLPNLNPILQSCKNTRSLDSTKSLHALLITMGSNLDQSTFFYNNIINLYASLGELCVARNVFDEMAHRSTVSYNTMICGYARCGNMEGSLKLFNEMRAMGFSPTQFTFGGLLSCEALDLHWGLQLLALVLKNGLLYSDAFPGTALLGLFGRCGCLYEAIQVFKAMPVKSLVTWNSMLSWLGQYRFSQECMFLFRELMRIEMDLSESSIVGVLTGFVWEEDLELGKQIHGLVIKDGLDHRVAVANSLMNMYIKCSDIPQAEILFEDSPVRDVVSWNTLISAFSKTENAARAIEIFLVMPADEVNPNQNTFVSIINSCASLQILMYGQFIHAKLIKNNSESNVFVGSALVDFYAKCDRIADAHSCFHEINGKSVVSWNALISGYATKCSPTSVSLLQEMLRLGFCPNEYSFSAALKPSLVFELQQLHSLITRMGYLDSEYVLGSLITSYAKNNLISDALTFVTDFDAPLPVVPSNIIAGIYNRTGQYHETQNLFSLLEEPDMVSWNILIAACARNGDYCEAFELFKHMQMDQICADDYTFVSLLNVCTTLCNLALGCSIHGLIIKTDFTCRDTFVCNVLMDMYGKCGNIGSSVRIFNNMTHRNLITWTVLISALGLNGFALQALERFREMELLGFKPDGVAFAAVLSACRHGGFVNEGIELFRHMKIGYKVEPQMDHYHCAVDMLSRYGHLKEAERLICSMPFPPNALIWRSFLEGCKRQRTINELAMV